MFSSPRQAKAKTSEKLALATAANATTDASLREENQVCFIVIDTVVIHLSLSLFPSLSAFVSFPLQVSLLFL